jgi:hypothetical protein
VKVSCLPGVGSGGSLWSGRTFTIDLGGALVTNGDGIELDHDGVVFRNQNDLITGSISIVVAARAKLSRLTNDGLDVPTTIALARCGRGTLASPRHRPRPRFAGSPASTCTTESTGTAGRETVRPCVGGAS